MKLEIITPGDDEYEQLDNRLVGFNARHVDWQSTTFQVIMKSHRDNLIGGARGIIRMKAVEIRGLWLDENQHGKGLGAQIISELETHAMKLGATSVLLDTYEFQARKFYEALGYEVFGKFRYPNDIYRFYMTKAL